jgi:2-keto-4-pentenoate hydratase/2-oxohepta-3-ene-1,7-dioic acid hydratase in catechol pathway
MAAAIGAGDEFLALSRSLADEAPDDARQPATGASWLVPVDAPVLRDCLTFEQHLRNAYAGLGIDVPDVFFKIPVYYKANPTTIVGHDAEIPWPNYTEHMDLELELGFVIGKPGRDLDPQQALESLFGITLFNDFSARDIQSIEMKSLLGPAKGKDFTTALGPWITTIDELDPHDIDMTVRVNGEEWSRDNSKNMMWTVGEILAYISQGETLVPGEVVGSGTAANGSGIEQGRRLQPGDVVELEASGIGILRNVIGPIPPKGWQPTPRTPKLG